MHRWIFGIFGLLACAAAASPMPPANDAKELSATVRRLVIQHLPDPLHRDERQWGKTKDGKTLAIRHGRPTTIHGAMNDGLWRRLRVDAINPRDNLHLEIRDIHTVDTATTAMTVDVAADVRFEAEQQQWESGIKLYGAMVRARARVRAVLKCQVTGRTEIREGRPEVVISLKVTEATTNYDKLTVEHVAGLGGTAAKLMGRSAVELIQQWKPSIERHLLEKANRAIVKAGQNKELRLGFGKLLGPRK